jgi:hypothetical protein
VPVAVKSGTAGAKRALLTAGRRGGYRWVCDLTPGINQQTFWTSLPVRSCSSFYA